MICQMLGLKEAVPGLEKANWSYMVEACAE